MRKKYLIISAFIHDLCTPPNALIGHDESEETRRSEEFCSGGRSGILLHRLLGEGGGGMVGQSSGSTEEPPDDFLADFQALQWK